MSKVLINEHKEMCLYLTSPLTLDQAKKMRSTLSYYNDLIQEIQGSKGVEDIYSDSGENFLGNNNAISNESDLNMLKNKEE